MSVIASETMSPTTDSNRTERLRILFLPADNIEPAFSRSAYLARGLARHADVYYVTWQDPRSASFQGKAPGNSHTLVCAAKSLLQRFRVERPSGSTSFHRVSASILLDAVLHRLVGKLLAARLKFAYNGRTLKSLVHEFKPDVVFYADCFYFFPAVDGQHVNVCDMQDDIEWSSLNGPTGEYVLRTFESQLARCDRGYIVSEAARNSFDRNLGMPFPFVVVSNGADFDEIRAVNSGEVEDLRTRHGLHGKYVVSYIGTNPKFDPEFSARLFATALERSPEMHFLIVGAIKPMQFANVTWVGSVSPRTAAAYYNLSDAGTILRDSRSDPFLHGSVPLKILQYVAARKPVVGYLPAWAKQNRFPNLFEMHTADTHAWCDRFRSVREQFAWTAGMDEVWEPYSWQAICQNVYDDLCELCHRKSPASAIA
jgi:glycosyltransferase involved in cell wall biosynthesis